MPSLIMLYSHILMKHVKKSTIDTHIMVQFLEQNTIRIYTDFFYVTETDFTQEEDWTDDFLMIKINKLIVTRELKCKYFNGKKIDITENKNRIGEISSFVKKNLLKRSSVLQNVLSNKLKESIKDSTNKDSEADKNKDNNTEKEKININNLNSEHKNLKNADNIQSTKEDISNIDNSKHLKDKNDKNSKEHSANYTSIENRKDENTNLHETSDKNNYDFTIDSFLQFES